MYLMWVGGVLNLCDLDGLIINVGELGFSDLSCRDWGVGGELLHWTGWIVERV